MRVNSKDSPKVPKSKAQMAAIARTIRQAYDRSWPKH
jgi:hypothetical protein